jgi:pimeloyl-ACP methyl ester carboxylesterase
MPTQFVDRMAVETDGEGEAVLMIHGLGGTSNVWTAVLPALARHRRVRPDLPGSGRSHRVEGPLSIARFVEAMQNVCASLGLERVHVAAHSLGTVVALHLAVVAPRLVRSLALFGPLASPPDAARSPLRERGARARRDGEAGMQAIADTLLATSVSAETRARRPVTVAVIRELLMRQCPDGYARTCEALADAQPADVTTITRPTLLVTGDEDAVAPAQAVRQLGERIPGARVEVLARCGHWTPLEKAAECDDLLRRFYAQRM